MNRRIQLISTAVAVIIFIVLLVFVIFKFAPSKEIMKLDDYYSMSGSSEDMAVVLQDSVCEEKGLYINGVPYISYTMITELFNHRFYWDKNEQLLLYTTPDKIIKASLDTGEYYINKANDKKDYNIVTIKDDVIYIAMPFVREYSDITYETYDLPNRIVIQYKWNINELVSTVKKDTVIRYEDSIKSPILSEVVSGDELTHVDTSEELARGFSKVVTKDGIIGYVKEKKLSESSYREKVSSFVKPVYTHITKDYDINMVWHQVTTAAANDGLLTLLNTTKGVNTISPTWFAIKDNEGNISSIASEYYVNRAHQAGVEVWGLCNDFSQNIDLSVVLGRTSSRERLANKLISTAIAYNLDGINIDFENITSDNGPDFVQFLRELSIKCRSNGIVLSVDNYIPAEYRSYYDYEEQGVVADYIVIMAYDEHYSGSEQAGSVSSLGFVSEAAKNITAMVDKERVIMALPFYTRLWKTKGENPPKSEAYSMSGIMSVLQNNGVKASWDEVTGQYYAEYKEGSYLCQVWLEEEKSLEEKLKAIQALGVHNVSFWRLGFEKSEVWNTIAEYINK